MCVVAVYALEEHLFVVDIDLVVAHLDSSESITVGRSLNHLTLSVFQCQDKGVQIGGLGGPQGHVGRYVAADAYGLRLGAVHRCDGCCLSGHLLVVRIEHLHLQFQVTEILAIGFHLRFHLKGGRFQIIAQAVGNMEVAHTYLPCGIQIHIAVDTAQAEHVLVFQIRAVAPSVHLAGYGVLSFAEIAGHVKLGVVVGTLRIAHRLAVYPDVEGTVAAVEVQEHLFVQPLFADVEGADIGTYRIVFLLYRPSFHRADEGRRVFVGIGDVGIDGRAVPLHLP